MYHSRGRKVRRWKVHTQVLKSVGPWYIIINRPSFFIQVSHPSIHYIHSFMPVYHSASLPLFAHGQGGWHEFTYHRGKKEIQPENSVWGIFFSWSISFKRKHVLEWKEESKNPLSPPTWNSRNLTRWSSWKMVLGKGVNQSRPPPFRYLG